VLCDGTGASLGRHYASSQLKLVLEDLPEAETFTVQKIINHCPSTKIPNTKELEVQWKGYDMTTWENEKHFIEWQCI